MIGRFCNFVSTRLVKGQGPLCFYDSSWHVTHAWIYGPEVSGSNSRRRMERIRRRRSRRGIRSRTRHGSDGRPITGAGIVGRDSATGIVGVDRTAVGVRRTAGQESVRLNTVPIHLRRGPGRRKIPVWRRPAILVKGVLRSVGEVLSHLAAVCLIDEIHPGDLIESPEAWNAVQVLLRFVGKRAPVRLWSIPRRTIGWGRRGCVSQIHAGCSSGRLLEDGCCLSKKG